MPIDLEQCSPPLVCFGGFLFWFYYSLLVTGLRNGVSKDFGDFATNSMFVWGQGTSKPYKGLPKGGVFNLK